MPIVVRYDDPAGMMALATQAGRAQGQIRGQAEYLESLRGLSNQLLNAGLRNVLAAKDEERKQRLIENRRRLYEDAAKQGPEAAAAFAASDASAHGRTPDPELIYMAAGQLSPDQQIKKDRATQQGQLDAAQTGSANALADYRKQQADKLDQERRTKEEDRRQRSDEFDRLNQGAKPSLMKAIARSEYVESGKMPEWVAKGAGLTHPGGGGDLTGSAKDFATALRGPGGAARIGRIMSGQAPTDMGQPPTEKDIVAAGSAIGTAITDPGTSLEELVVIEKSLEKAGVFGQPGGEETRAELEGQKAKRQYERDTIVLGVHEQVVQATGQIVSEAMKGAGQVSPFQGTRPKMPSTNTMIAVKVGRAIEELCKASGITVEQYREWKRRQQEGLDRTARAVNAQLIASIPAGQAAQGPERYGDEYAYDESGRWGKDRNKPAPGMTAGGP